MTLKQYKTARMLVALFIAATISVSVTLNNIYLAVAAVLIGMLFMIVIKRRIKGVAADERVMTVSEKASRITFAIFTPIIGIASFILIMIGEQGNPRLKFLGMVLSYLTLLSIAIYSFTFYFINRKMGGGSDEE